MPVSPKNTFFNTVSPKDRADYRAPIIIVGGGLAGLYAALHLAPMPVLIVTSAKLGERTSSVWAQGGISAAVDPEDSPKAHSEDTMRAGAGIVDPKMVDILTGEAEQNIQKLLEYGVPFDREADGSLSLSREAAHSARRVVRVRGDSAGRGIMEALVKQVLKTKSIRILDQAVAKRLCTDGKGVKAVCIWPKDACDDRHEIKVKSRFVLLAAGGVGGLFAKTTGPREANGEVMAMAAKAGAVIADPEFIQFHPTAIDADTDPVPLATEALRGEGAALVDRQGERFMSALHEDGELAPRDIVARGVAQQIKAGNGAFLDCREAIGDRFSHEFPAVYARCQDLGIDPEKELIPVAPATHYHMGGIFTDSLGRTTVDGLWACGEAASTGVHGANRLASNSLLEAVVFARRAAADIKGRVKARPGKIKIKLPFDFGSRFTAQSLDDADLDDRRVAHIRKIMSQAVGVSRNAREMRVALRDIHQIRSETPGNATVQNMALACEMIIVAALERQESRGGHFRTDFPASSRLFARRTMTNLKMTQKLVRYYIEQGDEEGPRLKLVVGH